MSYKSNQYYCLLILAITEDKFNGLYESQKFISTQKSQNYKRQEHNNTESLDELVNKIGSMKNKIFYT